MQGLMQVMTSTGYCLCQMSAASAGTHDWPHQRLGLSAKFVIQGHNRFCCCLLAVLSHCILGLKAAQLCLQSNAVLSLACRLKQ